MQEKYLLLKDIFDKRGSLLYFEEYFSNPETKEEELLYLISQESYRLRDFKGITQTRLRELIHKIFPEYPHGKTIKLDKWILGQYGYRNCSRCGNIKTIGDFTLNKTKSDGINCQCKVCQKEQTKKTQPARQAKYRAAGIRAIVPWTDLQEISKFYAECPSGYQVDHVIPLQGVRVSGLHVLNNLQYLSKEENLSKHNKFAE